VAELEQQIFGFGIVHLLHGLEIGVGEAELLEEGLVVFFVANRCVVVELDVVANVTEAGLLGELMGAERAQFRIDEARCVQAMAHALHDAFHHRTAIIHEALQGGDALQEREPTRLAIDGCAAGSDGHDQEIVCPERPLQAVALEGGEPEGLKGWVVVGADATIHEFAYHAIGVGGGGFGDGDLLGLEEGGGSRGGAHHLPEFVVLVGDGGGTGPGFEVAAHGIVADRPGAAAIDAFADNEQTCEQLLLITDAAIRSDVLLKKISEHRGTVASADGAGAGIPPAAAEYFIGEVFVEADDV